ncbi:hypothetical protein Fmac_023870 [Flemingia macrophylla]|uniref:Phototropic-responsive NPH3 family protein n=1 Tax=Flemingia macrophylla TaxID=520843 RepID=A0ABD1LMS7_9FABA
MASMKLGSKSEMFNLFGQSWLCSYGLPSDVIIEIGDTSFHLHKFPLISRSKVLVNLMKELSNENEKSIMELHDLPGGAKAFLLVAKFCYGVKIELTALNVVCLRCAAEYLQMTEKYGEGNLIMQTENFLNHVFGNWTDTLKALKTCEEVLPFAEELHIISRCIHSLVLKVVDQSLVNLPVSGHSVVQSSEDAEVWNGITLTPKTSGEDWWFEDISSLSLSLYKRFMQGASARHMKPKRIAGSLVYYAKKHIPLLGSQPSSQNGNSSAFKSSHSTPSEADQRNLIEEIVELMPNEKGIAPTKFLLACLRTAMALYASSSCCASLEKRIVKTISSTKIFEGFMNSQNPHANLALVRNDGNTPPPNSILAFDNMKERVAELEKECLSMKRDLEKMMKSKGSWNMILKKLGCKLVPKPSNATKISKPCRKSKISPASTAQMEEKAMEVK